MRRNAEISLILALVCSLKSSQAAPPQPTFYLPLDNSTVAALAGGARQPVRKVVGQTDTILELLSLRRPRFVAGKVGPGYDIGDQPLVYECAGNFRADEGTCSFWVSPDWRGDDRNLYSTLFGAADWGMVYKYQDQTSLTFATAKPDQDLYYDCGVPDISAWRPGDWHHIVVTWSRLQNERRLYVDGAPAGRAPFPFHREVLAGPLFIGAGCTLYPQPVAHAKLDEVALWDRPLDEVTVRELQALGLAGKPLWTTPTATATPPHPGMLNVVTPQTPAAPGDGAPARRQIGPRTQISLNGWWAFLPATEELPELPTAGWGLCRIPGYWTAPADTLGPDGKALASRRWEGQPLTRYWIAYLQRSFVADPAWRSRRVLLRLDGVDGLVQVCLNGTPLGWLPAWESEGYDIGALLRYGDDNTLTLILRTRGGSANAGVYGDVGLDLVSGLLIQDVSVRTPVAKGQIEFSCGVWYPGPPLAATLTFAVTARAAPDTVLQRFTQSCRLSPPAGNGPELSSQVQRVSATFAWKDARRWTFDDPFLYDVTAELRAGPSLEDRSGPHGFGFREFTRQGAEVLLNGTPIHLRGHQIDLPWGEQFERVKELRAAGLNALELSGPISCDWYSGSPYQKGLFEQILTYCDENGLVAAPILPDLAVIKDRVFDPDVAELYRRRVEKHIRAYGNHPSIGLWYMHFNLAGYQWYLAPSKIDGSYKPDDPGFQARERFAMEAQRIAQAVDARPLYHHACGNFGDIFTANCYLGPNSPTQEREEWPSRWAAKRPFPFIACEHCCLLIPYWFRPRQFPLSVVYAGEPIFDELSAMYLGPGAYASITPELFEVYDLERTPRGSRMRTLIRRHPGYQATKALVAQHALRAWRTYGVTGILFNAENWDFKDDAGQPLPVMRALARYFGDTDLYIAGPGDDWPAKDHGYYGGETVRKQVVLLDDLTRDLPVTLRWRVTDAVGTTHAAGLITATARAGIPTFAPLEFQVPAVAQRTDCRLTVEPVPAPEQQFQPESFALQVFPPRRAPPPTRGVLLYDPVGDTTRMLARAGVPWTSLSPTADLSRAALVVVGRKSYDAAFVALAKALNLETAIRGGLRLLVFEQTSGSPLGLQLEETSTRQAFIAVPGHPLLAGLQAADLHDLRGQSDLIEPYPDAAPETQRAWPARSFKWGNRGIVATYVYGKPHYLPFRPLLHSGFDLVQSALLEARFGQGSVTLCQVDVTPRYGTDPVSTALVDNLVRVLSQPERTATLACSYVGTSARSFLTRFGIAASAFGPETATGVIVVGTEAIAAAPARALEQAARAGATVVLLPQTAAGATFGLRQREERLFAGRMTGADPLLAGVHDGDLYLKAWTTLSVAVADNGWRPVVEPGLLSVRTLGTGRIVACQIALDDANKTRGQVKALRFWNLLLANLEIERNADTAFVAAPRRAYEDNDWEHLPPYINW
jgi:beta-galactosidase